MSGTLSTGLIVCSARWSRSFFSRSPRSCSIRSCSLRSRSSRALAPVAPVPAAVCASRSCCCRSRFCRSCSCRSRFCRSCSRRSFLLLLRLCLLVQTLAQRLCPRAQIASGGRLRILAQRLVSVADRCGVIVLRQAGLATSKDPSHRFSAFTGSRGAFELQPAEGGLLLLLSAPRFDGAYVLAKRRQRFRDAADAPE